MRLSVIVLVLVYDAIISAEFFSLVKSSGNARRKKFETGHIGRRIAAVRLALKIKQETVALSEGYGTLADAILIAIFTFDLDIFDGQVGFQLFLESSREIFPFRSDVSDEVEPTAVNQFSDKVECDGGTFPVFRIHR